MSEGGPGPQDPDRVRDGLAAALAGVRRGQPAADELCRSFVELLDVDGAALTILTGADFVSAALGASDPLVHQLLDLEFMLGEGPFRDAAETSAPVMAADLDSTRPDRWPHFAEAASRLGVRAVFAIPVTSAGFVVGALFLHRTRAGPLSGAELAGAFFAAGLAMLPILDAMTVDLDAADQAGTAWSELTTLHRPEVYQATGVLIAQLGITPPEALVRLRAHAFAHGRTTSETAYDILEHRVRLDDDRPDGRRPEDDS